MGNIFNQTPASLSTLSKAKRDLALGLKRSPLFSWRYGSHNVQQLMLVPRDLRTADPSLSIELDMGQFGLAGATVFLNGGSPFQAEPPNTAWLKELHGFSWVRNLRAARTDRAQEQAMELTREWLTDYKTQKGIAWEPEVAARRLISWLSHSNFLLYEADEKAYINLMASIEEHMRFLSMTGMHAAKGMPRLLSLISLMFAGLCVKEQEKFAEQHLKLMCNELDNQILPDGGHISRDNSVLASILLDLLPLKQCFVTRNMTPPQPLQDAINRMLPMIHYMRLGDGLMSRFNGAGTTLPDTLSTAMAYDDVSNAPLKEAPYSRYFRMQKGNVVVLMDGGPPASLELSAKAHAGCLSFELSSGTCPVIVNCGAAPPAFQTMSSNARATVSHSTLTVNNRSSAQFHHDHKVKNSHIPSLLSGPPTVKAWYEKEAEKVKIIGSHDGYLDNFGLIHHRLLSLSNDGYTFIGEDWIEALGGSNPEQKLGWPYAVHFHIHPDVETTRSSDGKSITLKLPDSQEWKLSAQGAIISLEESIFYADFAGPCQSVQAVLRGNCVGNTSISWMLAKVVQSHSDKPPKVPEWMAENVIPLEKAAAIAEKDDAPEKKEKEPVEASDVPPPPPARKVAKVTELVEDIDDETGGGEDKSGDAQAALDKEDVPALEAPRYEDSKAGSDKDGTEKNGNRDDLKTKRPARKDIFAKETDERKDFKTPDGKGPPSPPPSRKTPAQTDKKQTDAEDEEGKDNDRSTSGKSSLEKRATQPPALPAKGARTARTEPDSKFSSEADIPSSKPKYRSLEEALSSAKAKGGYDDDTPAEQSDKPAKNETPPIDERADAVRAKAEKIRQQHTRSKSQKQGSRKPGTSETTDEKSLDTKTVDVNTSQKSRGEKDKPRKGPWSKPGDEE